MIPFTYVKNVADAVALSIASPAVIGGTYIVGDRQSYRVRDIVKQLADRLGSNPRIVRVPGVATRALMSIRRVVPSTAVRQLIDRARLDTLAVSVGYSITAFERATGYVPRYSLADAAAHIAEWYMDVGSLRGR